MKIYLVRNRYSGDLDSIWLTEATAQEAIGQQFDLYIDAWEVKE